MKRNFIYLLVVMLLVFGTSGLFAQDNQDTQDTNGQIAETSIIGIEIGQLIGYNFNTEEIGVGQVMALHFGLTDAMELGFVFVDGDGGVPTPDMPDFRFLRLTYFLSNQFGFHLSTGSDGMNNPAGGIGMFTTPLRREVNDTVTTALRLSVDYLMPDFTTAFDEAILGLGITGKIAF